MHLSSCCTAVLLLSAVTLTLSTPESHKDSVHRDHQDHGASAHVKDGEHDTDYDHKAVLGSEGDAEEYSHLKPEVAKQKLGKLVKKMDADSDGFVSEDELKHWIQNSFKHLNEEEAASTMKDLDLDNDRKVSITEHLQSLYEVDSVDKLADEDDKMYARMDEDRFNAADQDKSGLLDSKEYAAFTHPYDYVHMVPSEVERLLKEMDKDKDGQLSFEEYSTAGGRELTDDDRQAEQDSFSLHDTNKDTMMSREEIGKWIAPEEAHLADEEVTHLMGATDTNGDGKLSSEEIVDKHELWVGSEATDFGNHLERDEL